MDVFLPTISDMASISIRQNRSSAVKKLAAQRHLYSKAKILWGLLLILNLLILPPLTIYALYNLFLTPYIGILSIFALLVNVLCGLWIRDLKKAAASIQELFDNEVLEIPLNNLLLSKIDLTEEIELNASRHLKRHGDKKLKNWYPTALSKMPLTKAQITAQRTNSWWDYKLRTNLIYSIVAIMVIIAVFEFIIGVKLRLALNEWIIAVIVPTLPIVQLLGQELYKHWESKEIAAKNLNEAKSLLRLPLRSNKGTRIRALQDSIFNHRVNAPLVFDWIYFLTRTINETIMKTTASKISKDK